VRRVDRNTSVPAPDFAILAALKPDFEKRHPNGDELVLGIEVSDSTVSFDLNRRAALYAAAGVPEYWVLDVTRRRLVVHKQPGGSDYHLRQLLSENDTVAVEGKAIRVRDLVPAA
jgi:Uma2 family endonuclease